MPACAYANACVCVCYPAPGGALSEVCSSQTAALLLPVSLTPAAPWHDCVSLRLATAFGAPPTNEHTFFL